MSFDTSRCMALRDGARILSGDFCQEEATHLSYLGTRLCAHHAEKLRVALRNPDSLGNVLAGRVTGSIRGRTEEEIAKLVVALAS